MNGTILNAASIAVPRMASTTFIVGESETAYTRTALIVRSVDGAGSFVRPSPNIIYGHSFLAALRSKYVEELHGSSTQEKVTLGSSAGAIEVEAVDLDKIRKKFGRLDRLRQVSLDDENVSQADAPAEIQKTCPSDSFLAWC